MHAAGGLIPSRQALRATYNQKLQCELIPRKHRWKLIPLSATSKKTPSGSMEVERINQIESLIEDLRSRLVELRGYL